jgi:regulatory protein
MRITRIETQKRHPGRKSIYADDAFLIGVSVETLLRAGLRVGDTLTEAQLRAMQENEGILAAKSAAHRFLGVRPRSEREIRDKLREKEFTPEQIQSVVADLTRAGLVNDAEFARSMIRNSLAVRPVGELTIRRKLLLLGVARPVVDDAIHDVYRARDPSAVALTVARQFLKRKSHSARNRDPRTEQQRLIAFLSRRGFAWPVIQNVLQSLKVKPEDDQSGL